MHNILYKFDTHNGMACLKFKPTLFTSVIVIPVDSNHYPGILRLACRWITNTPANCLLNVVVS